MLRAATDFCFVPGWTPDVKSSARADNSNPVLDENVNGRLSTAGATVPSQANSCEDFGGQIGTGAVFLRVFRFYPFSINPPMHGTYSLIYYRRYTIIATDSVFKYHTWKRKLVIYLLKIRLSFILETFFVWRHCTGRTAYGLLFTEFIKKIFWQITL